MRLALVSVLGIRRCTAARRIGEVAGETSAPVVSGQPVRRQDVELDGGHLEQQADQLQLPVDPLRRAWRQLRQISGSTSKTYTSTSADVNHTLASWVTATNGGGTVGPVNSKQTNLITPALQPSITTQPSIVGKPFVDSALVADPGKYSGGAVARFDYRWQRCNQSLNCSTISGATGQSYKATTADVGQRLRVQVTATNPFGKTTNTSAATDAITVSVVVVSTTMRASAATTICCQKVRLSGTVSPAKAGEQIRIFARQVDDLANLQVATATADASGNWSALVTPVIRTAYTAQTSTSTGSPMTVAVHPRIGFGVNGNTFSAKVTGRGSFAGRVAHFQMQNASGGWRTISLVVINQFSVAKFHVALKKGHTYTLRIKLSQPQAGTGYLDGISHARRVGGTA